MRATLESAYVLVVAAIAAYGFGAGSTAAILTAAVLALPTSIVAVPGFYLAYGLLALVPGANPSSGSGSGGCSPGGGCRVSTSGELAPWFAVTTDVIGLLALAGAALLNVLLLRMATQPPKACGSRFRGDAAWLVALRVALPRWELQHRISPPATETPWPPESEGGGERYACL